VNRFLASSETDVELGLVRSVLSVNVQASTLVPNGTAYAIGTRVAAVMLIRGDVMIDCLSDPWVGEFGLGVCLDLCARIAYSWGSMYDPNMLQICFGRCFAIRIKL